MSQGKIIGLIAILMLTGCRPSGADIQTVQPARALSNATTKQPHGGNSSSALSNVLTVFVSDKGQDWTAYDSLHGVVWSDQNPVEYADGKLAKTGRLLLTGFGIAKLPNGKTGADYSVIEGNEGQSGVTLDGNAQSVETLSVKKFYFSGNYQDVLQQQLGTDDVVKLIAGHCSPEEDTETTENNAFFELDLSSGKTLFGEAFHDDGGKYSPGYTVFDFYRDKPVAQMLELKCREV